MVSKAEIVSQAAEGTLHQFIVDNYERGGEADDAAIQNLAVKLHNRGDIDLLSALTPQALEDVKGFHFFTLQQFYCAVIPKLEADPLRLMGAVSGLVNTGGEDMAANMPNAAFRDWCAAKPERPDTVLALIEADAEGAKHNLTFALEAGAASDLERYVRKAIAYLQQVPDLRLGALTALARIDVSTDAALARDAMTAVVALLVDGVDEMLATHVFAAVVGLYKRSPDVLHDAAFAAMREAVQNGSDGALHQCASVLFNERTKLSEPIVELLLTALEGLNPKNLGTINSLDVALSELIKAGKGQRVSEFLESVLLQHPDELSMKNFDSVGYALMMSDRALCDDIVVRWLLSGKSSLASEISEVIGSTGNDPATFDIDIKPYSLSDTEAIFLARKAVGWFFFRPITAASLIICILRTVKGQTANDIGDLLFEPLLLNYSGELREYLGKKLKGPRDKAKPQIRRALGKLEAYMSGLQNAGFIDELAPSERERLIEQQQQNERMRQIQKQAEASSVLLSFVSRSIILHGNGSVSYVRGLDGTLHRNAMKMGGFNTTWEAPRLQVIDPFGLDMQLRHFRSERLAS